MAEEVLSLNLSFSIRVAKKQLLPNRNAMQCNYAKECQDY